MADEFNTLDLGPRGIKLVPLSNHFLYPEVANFSFTSLAYIINNALIAQPFSITDRAIFSNVRYNVASAGSAGESITFGIYTNVGNYPGKLISPTATGAMDSTGEKTLALNATAGPRFWLVYNSDSITAQVTAYDIFNDAVGGNINSPSVGLALLSTYNAGVLPSMFPSGASPLPIAPTRMVNILQVA